MIDYARFTAAAVQAAPVYLDTAATVEKACGLIAEAALNGARLIVFPEVFVPGYPYWNWTMTPGKGSPWFERLFRAAIDIPGPEVDALRTAAQAAGAQVVIGVNERDPFSMGTLYNSLLFIGGDGELLGVHRKLVPTWAEKLTWAGGDGSSLRVYDTPTGRIGGLACGENTNTLARFTLLAQGENVHCATYISLPTAPADYDMVEAIKVRGAAHSFEGKVFTVVACSSITAATAAISPVGSTSRKASLATPVAIPLAASTSTAEATAATAPFWSSAASAFAGRSFTESAISPQAARAAIAATAKTAFIAAGLSGPAVARMRVRLRLLLPGRRGSVARPDSIAGRSTRYSSWRDGASVP